MKKSVCLWIRYLFCIGLSCLLLSSCASVSKPPVEPDSLNEIVQPEEDAELFSPDKPVSPEPSTSSHQQNSQEETPNDSLNQQTSSEPLATLFLASDYQQEEGWPQPSETLSGLLNTLSSQGTVFENAIFCGDYTNLSGLYNYETSPDDSIADILALFTQANPNCSPENIIFVQGNHDQMTESISTSGLHEYEDYLVYVINTQTDFPWKQGQLGLSTLVQNTANNLNDCLSELIAEGETRPVIIASHVPLHFSGRTSPLHSTGDNLYSAVLFEVVNQAAQQLDCIYLYGHNHSKGWDSYLGGSCTYLAAGDTILLPDFSRGGENTTDYVEQTINFTYLNPGYLGYVSDSGAEDTLTCTVCEIYEDQIVLTRYNQDGIYLMRGAGAANPYRDDTELIPAQWYVSELESPQSIPRKAKKLG